MAHGGLATRDSTNRPVVRCRRADDFLMRDRVLGLARRYLGHSSADDGIGLICDVLEQVIGCKPAGVGSSDALFECLPDVDAPRPGDVALYRSDEGYWQATICTGRGVIGASPSDRVIREFHDMGFEPGWVLVGVRRLIVA